MQKQTFKDVSGAHMFVGPMFSEKTSSVLRMMRMAKLAEISHVMLKPIEDDRYKPDQDDIRPMVRSHDGMDYEAKEIADFSTFDVTAYQVIGVDEGQFCQGLPDMVRNCIHYNVQVYIAALDATARGNLWPIIEELMPLCTYTKLSGICHFCKAPSTSTVKIGGNMEVVEEIGGYDKYRPACAKCFLSHCNGDPQAVV